VRLGANRRRIYVDNAGVEIKSAWKARFNVSRVNRKPQPVRNAVGHLDRVFQTMDGNHGHHGPEDLLLGDCGMVGSSRRRPSAREPGLRIRDTSCGLNVYVQILPTIAAVTELTGVFKGWFHERRSSATARRPCASRRRRSSGRGVHDSHP